MAETIRTHTARRAQSIADESISGIYSTCGDDVYDGGASFSQAQSAPQRVRAFLDLGGRTAL